MVLTRSQARAARGEEATARPVYNEDENSALDEIPTHHDDAAYVESKKPRKNTKKKKRSNSKKKSKSKKKASKKRKASDEADAEGQPKKRAKKRTSTASFDDEDEIVPPKEPTRFAELDGVVVSRILTFSFHSLNDVYSLMRVCHQMYDTVARSDDMWYVILNDLLLKHPWTQFLPASNDWSSRPEMLVSHLESEEYLDALQEHAKEVKENIEKALAEPASEDKKELEYVTNPLWSINKNVVAHLKNCEMHCNVCMLPLAQDSRKDFSLHVGYENHPTSAQYAGAPEWNGPHDLSLCPNCKRLCVTKTTAKELIAVKPDWVDILPRKLQRNPHYRNAAPMRKFSLHSVALYACKIYRWPRGLEERQKKKAERARRRSKSRWG